MFFSSPKCEIPFYTWKGLRRIDIYFCYFSFDIIQNAYNNFKEQFSEITELLFEKTSHIHAGDSDNKEIRDIFIRMIDEALSNLLCNKDALTGYLLIMLTKIFRNIKTRNFKRVYSQDRTVDEAMRYININMYSKISLRWYRCTPPRFIIICLPSFQTIYRNDNFSIYQFLRVNKIKDILKIPINQLKQFLKCSTAISTIWKSI